MRIAALACFGLCSAFGARAAWAIDQTVFVAEDTFVASATPTNMRGASTSIFTGRQGLTPSAVGDMRGLIKFNMPAASPSLAGRVTVTGARLNLFTKAMGRNTAPYDSYAPFAGLVSLYRVNSAWTQGGGGGATSAGVACVSAASWNNADCTAGTGWSWNGASATYSSPHAVDTNISPFSGSLVADVQAWIDGASNQGWLLASNTEGGTDSRAQRFHSSNDSSAPSLDISYNCKSPYEVFGNACTTCGATGRAACAVDASAGVNGCNDPGGAATTFTCSCNSAAYVASGGAACVNRDECTENANPCDNDGDSSGVCNDTAAPGTGWSCTCNEAAGFVPSGDGKRCITACGGGSDPCGNGGTCALVGTGSWTCACPSGYASTGGAHPSCEDLDACAGNAACTVFPGNACVDDPAPALTYQCTCTNAGTELGTKDGKPACVDKNGCVGAALTECVVGGDSGAGCADAPAPDPGHSCTCSSPQWTPGLVGSVVTCVDTDECAGAVNPCGKGVCTNVADGGGYKCECIPGFVSYGDPKTPTCINANECADNRCVSEGDRNADCINRTPPKLGYDCDCSPGWTYDGKTCVDRNECAGGNPCGSGSCANTKGGYQCACPAGFESSGGAAPTCQRSSSGYVDYTATAGSLCSTANGDAPLWTTLWPTLWIALALWLARRQRGRRVA